MVHTLDELVQVQRETVWPPLTSTGAAVRRAATRRQRRRRAIGAAGAAAAIVAVSLAAQQAWLGTPATAPSPRQGHLLSGPAEPGGPSGATTPGLSPSDQAAMDAQAPYMDLQDKVYAINGSLRDAPMAGTGFDIAARTLTVYWAGPVPAPMTRLQSEAKADGITMRIVRAPYSLRQLQVASRQVTGEDPGQILPVLVDFPQDGSGFTVSAPGLVEASTAKTRPSPVLAHILKAIADARAATGIPIKIADSAGGGGPL